jgi:hypothetical protein
MSANSSSAARTVTARKNCRSRKTKCSGHQPTCEACRKSDYRCEYPPGSKRRLANRHLGDTPPISSTRTESARQPQSQTLEPEAATTLLRDVLDWNLEPLDLPESLLAALHPDPHARTESSPGSVSHSPTRALGLPKSRLRIPYFRCVHDKLLS